MTMISFSINTQVFGMSTVNLYDFDVNALGKGTTLFNGYHPQLTGAHLFARHRQTSTWWTDFLSGENIWLCHAQRQRLQEWLGNGKPSKEIFPFPCGFCDRTENEDFDSTETLCHRIWSNGQPKVVLCSLLSRWSCSRLAGLVLVSALSRRLALLVFVCLLCFSLSCILSLALHFVPCLVSLSLVLVS